MRIYHFSVFSLIFSLLTFTSCGNENDWPELSQGGGEALDTLSIDETPLTDEVETVITPENEGYKDFAENFLYDDDTQTWDDGVKSLDLTFSDSGVSYVYKTKKGTVKDIDPEDFTITTNSGHVTVTAHTKCHYTLTGCCTDGQFKLYSDKKFILTLGGIDLTNKSGSAINIQKGNDGSKRCFLDIADGTENYLADGTTYNTPDDEDEKAVVFSEGALITTGSGYLKVTGNGKSGIASDDYVYLHKGPRITILPNDTHQGIKSNDGIIIGGGVLNIRNTAVTSIGMATDSTLTVTGGRTIVISGSPTPLYYSSLQHTGGTLKVNNTLTVVGVEE